MASRVLTKEMHDALIASFREAPGNIIGAARRAKVGKRMAYRAWHEGWPHIPWASKPASEMIREEDIRVRAEQRRAEEASRRQGNDERDKARQDAVAAMAQEGRILALARADIQGALGSASLMLPALRAVAEKAAAAMLQDPAQFSPKLAVQLVREYSFAVRALTNSAEQVVRAERLHKGEPTDILGVSVAPSEMTLEEAAREIKAASSLYELAKQQGLISDPDAPSEGANGSNGGETIN